MMIGSVVLREAANRQTDRQTDRQTNAGRAKHITYCFVAVIFV